MNVLAFLPHSIPLQNKIGMLARTAHYDFFPCASEGDVLAHMSTLYPENKVLLFTDQANLHLVQTVSQTYPKAFVVLMLSSPLQKVARLLADCLSVQCFVAKQNEDFDARDILTMLRKFSDTDIAGLEKYLGYSASIDADAISSPADKQRVIHCITEFVDHLGGDERRFAEYSRRIAELIDELILNAIFDANPSLVHAVRSTEFLLPPEEAVQVRWGFDGEVFGLSVRDCFGNLSKDTIIRYLDEVPSDTTAIHERRSAGLGLKLVFERLHQFIVNVQPGKMTEIICLLRFEKRFRDFESRLRSFHYYSK